MKLPFTGAIAILGILFATNGLAEDNNKAEELYQKIAPGIQKETQSFMSASPTATFPCCLVCIDIKIPLDGSIKKCATPPGDACNMC
jgi:hypothetical protein